MTAVTSGHAIIEAVGLTRTFGDVVAVDSLDLRIYEGEIFGLLGPNGAGKSTTVRMLSGLIGASHGEATVAGVRVGHPSQASELRRLVGVVPEEAGLYPDMCAAETLVFFARLYGIRRRVAMEKAMEMLEQLDLARAGDRPVATFSKGMRQRLALARAVMHDPCVLFLDEPTANLDPEGALVVRDLLRTMRAKNCTVVLNTHRLEEAERLCDRVGVLATRLVAVGTPSELRSARGNQQVLVRLAGGREPIVSAVTHAGWAVSCVENTLVVEVADPEINAPDVVDTVVRAGGRVLEVGSTGSLEDAYHALVGEGR